MAKFAKCRNSDPVTFFRIYPVQDNPPLVFDCGVSEEVVEQNVTKLQPFALVKSPDRRSVTRASVQTLHT